MVMRREGKPEPVTHEAIMSELVEMKRAAEERGAAINRRLDAGAKKFDQLEKAVQPLTDLITAMGGEAAFREIGEDAARGLAALAWLGKKVGKLAKWIAVVVAGCVAVGAAAKFLLFDFWRPMQ